MNLSPIRLSQSMTGAGEQVAGDGESDLDAEVDPDPARIDVAVGDAANYLVDDQLADPELGDREEGAEKGAGPGWTTTSPGLGVPNHPQQRREVLEGREPVAPG